MRYGSILDTIGNTPLVDVPRLSPAENVRLWVKLEGENPTGSTKDRIALALVEAGERSGEMTPEKTLLEPTSGNTGIALAMVCATKGYRFTAVMPDNASSERVQMLKAFGADIIFSPG
ncbi:MAG: pyridoxal-phosphate dependent enzyme, partial [Actinomycetota bacterium]|nr:pyridoxal-phosphate dependent enzyme [Actinomycetota bacterium]